jgi:hypothetical protein
MHEDLWLLVTGALIAIAVLALSAVPAGLCMPLPGSHRCTELSKRYRNAFAPTAELRPMAASALTCTPKPEE